MAMLLVLPKLPRDVVEHIRTYVYGPQIAAFIANYGERIPARVVHPHRGLPYMSDLSFMWGVAITWGDGLCQPYNRFLWRLPKQAMHYLTRGMPVLLRLGADWASSYTVIEVRHSTLLVGFGTCEIEIPNAIIRDITLYVDILDDRDTDDMFMCYKEGVATAIEQQIQRDSEIGFVKNDDVEYVRDKYTTERWLYAMQYLEGVDLCC